MLSNKQMFGLQEGKIVSFPIKVKSETLRQAIQQASQELDELRQPPTRSQTDFQCPENQIIADATYASRIGQFPFFRRDTEAPTSLDALTLHPQVVDLATQALAWDNDTCTGSVACDSNNVRRGPYPILMDAFVDEIETKENDRKHYDRYERYSFVDAPDESRQAVDAVQVWFNLSYGQYESIKHQDEQNVSLQVCRLDCNEEVNALNDQNYFLRIVFRSSAATHLEMGDRAYIRYLEHASEWMTQLNPSQRSALGFPPDRHEYWANPHALKQAQLRYPCMDLAPYQSSRSVIAPLSSQESVPDPPAGAKSNDPRQTYKDIARWVEPMPLNCKDETLFSMSQVNQFREEGYLFVKGIWPNDVMTDAIKAAEDLWPFKPLTNPRYSPRNFSFPFHDNRLNRITLHPHLLSVISQLLEVPIHQVRIMQSGCYAKRGDPEAIATENDASSNQTVPSPQCFVGGNQPMHQDFGSNTLLTPARNKFNWDHVEEVQGILYYNDHEQVEGGTAFVPGLRHTGADPIHVGWLPDDMQNDPRPSLYAAERKAAYSAGSILLFQLGTWHRGTPVNANAMRRVHHLCFRRADAFWLGGSTEFGQPSVQSLRAIEYTQYLNELNPAQRSVIGLPKLSSTCQSLRTPESVACL